MKKIVTLSALLLFFAIVFSSCEKIEKETPLAIKKLIKERHRSGGQVVEYEYNKEYIYKWWEPCCDDCFTKYYDKNANLLWKDGGYEGLRGLPEDFYDKAIYKRIVWTNKKTQEYLENNKK
jgi:hypothetical protein